MIRARLLPLAAAIAVVSPVALQAQGIAVRAGRFVAHQDLNVLGVSLSRGDLGPIGLDLTGARYGFTGDAAGALWGVGLEAQVLRWGAARPYVLAGGELGLGPGDSPFWGSWSAGLGWGLWRGGPVALAAEGRYRRVSKGIGAGVELGLRASFRLGHRVMPAPLTPAGGAADTGAPEAGPGSAPPGPTGVAAGVVQTAFDAMGTPYRWGGSAEDAFDCSGLIQYAYQRQGVRLPRSSAEQAGVGTAVERKMGLLVPGDILTFATRSDGAVSHVGLYVGDGRFIHSSGTGVRVSRLRDDDPYGAWWFRRWVGARRVVP